MPRLIPAFVGLAALMTAVPSAAQVGSGRIAYASHGGMYTVAADGSGPRLLRSGNARLPRWSPDGSQVAFTYYTGTPLGVQLRVMGADGSNEHVVATDGDWQGIWLSKQPWSSDGSRLAWGPQFVHEGDIYTASAAGGDVRRVTTDGRWKEAPVWSPTTSQLAYAAHVPGSPFGSWELFTVHDDGSAPVQITSGGFQNLQPMWSPGGSSIAFVRTDGPQREIYVIRPDGTDLHRVADASGESAGEPAWSPDGSKIAYSNAERTSGRWGGQEIFLVNADGSGERRLTDLAPRAATDAAPTWSPDGDQIAFTRTGPLGGGALDHILTMNPDGTCEGPLAAEHVSGSPSWQAVPGGPNVGPKTCRAVAIEATQPPDGNHSAIVVGGTVSNEGTEPLTNVIVTISTRENDFSLQKLPDYPCTRIGEPFVCRIDRLGRGESRNVAVLGTARRVGRNASSRSISLIADLKVTPQPDVQATGREHGWVIFTPGRCVTSDPGRGRIDGTQFPDRICGRRGADSIDPRDRKDYVYGGAGRDVVKARDRYGDVISCGPGRDLVFADRKDRVARDCERVRRR